MLRTALVTIAATLSVAGLAVAAPGHGSAGKAAAKAAKPAVAACKAERETLGKDAFRAKYAKDGKKRALRVCVRQHVKGARRACRIERKADKAAFKAKYAVEGKKRRAMRVCVAQHAADPVA